LEGETKLRGKREIKKKAREHEGSRGVSRMLPETGGKKTGALEEDGMRRRLREKKYGTVIVL